MPENKHRRDPDAFVYLIWNPETALHKIGVSVSPTGRLSGLNGLQGVRCEVLHTIKTNSAYRLEKYLHYAYASKRVHGEWFKLTAADVEEIKLRDVVEYTDPGIAKRRKALEAGQKGVNIPVEMWFALDALSAPGARFEDRSVTWLLKLAVKNFLDANK